MDIHDLTGKRFHLLTVTRFAGKDKHGNALWECRCQCGSITKVKGANLRSGNTKACGCLKAAVDISGKRFGRLVALNLESGGRRHYWRFACDCGQETVARKSHVTTGRIVSCGCYIREATIARFTTHGMSRTTEYNIWTSMIQRCENENHAQYKDYGGRGIRVCDRWHDFSNFFADMGPRPRGKTIDRIDNNKGYEPGNCRWATWKEQNASGRRRPSHRPSVSQASQPG